MISVEEPINIYFGAFVIQLVIIMSKRSGLCHGCIRKNKLFFN